MGWQSEEDGFCDHGVRQDASRSAEGGGKWVVVVHSDRKGWRAVLLPKQIHPGHSGLKSPVGMRDGSAWGKGTFAEFPGGVGGDELPVVLHGRMED